MMRIPINPHYEFEQPTVRGQYVNPITLNNCLIANANDYYDTVEKLAAGNRNLAKLKQELSVTEATLNEFEQELLLEFPASASDRKSNKLIDTYLRKIVYEHPEPQTRKTWEGFHAVVRKLKAEIVATDLERDIYIARMGHLKLESENIKTHLSFVKSGGRSYGGG